MTTEKPQHFNKLSGQKEKEKLQCNIKTQGKL